ncbi:MAG: MBL fold metallo-hydrolase [Alphaproteobacteria bacterium]|nr:MBL fold metallo-hydrolase [Alphaproteobacteria bacterium]
MAEKRTEFESLGGNNLDGIGGNAKKITYTAEDGSKRSIQIDCGMKFSDKAVTGVDNYIAPLECDDLLITHAHADHIAGIIHHIQMNPDRPLNIYADQFTHHFMVAEMTKQGLPLDNMPTFHDVKDGEKFKVNGFEVEPVPVTHSAPGAIAFVVESPDGTRLMDMGDFKTTPAELGKGWEDERMAGVFAKGIDVCFCDSTSTTSKEVTPSYEAVTKGFKKILYENPNAQMMVGTIARSAQQMMADVIAVAEYAKETGTKPRTFILDGASLVQVNNALNKSGMSMSKACKERTGVDVKIIDAKSPEAKSIPPQERIYMVTGTQGEEMAAMARVSRGENRNIRPSKSCPNLCVNQQAVIPSGNNQEVVDEMMAALRAQGWKTMIPERGAPFVDGETYYVSGHGRAGDMEKVADIAAKNQPTGRPCTFIGIHGNEEQTHATEAIFEAKGEKVEHITNAQKVVVSKGEVQVSPTIGKASRIAVIDQNDDFMNPDFRYIKEAFNPVSKKWEKVTEVEYEKILVSKKDREKNGKGGKGGKDNRGHGGKKHGHKGHRDMSPVLMQKMQRTH